MPANISMAETEQTERTSTTTTSHTVHEKPKQDLLSNVLAIAGLVILAVIVIWGLLHLATLVAPSLSSLFSRAPKIQITAPASATSGTPFTISWKYSTSEKGGYAFLYQCKAGLQFDTPSVSGTSSVIPCGAAYTVGVVTTLSLTPRLSATSSLDAPFSVIFIPAATTSKQVQGTATVKINPAAAPVVPTQTVKPATPTTPTAPRVSGPVDLSVSIISATVDQWGNATVVFDIGNVGGSASGAYSFSAQLPTSGTYPYASPQQVSLGVGDHVVNTLRFSQAVPGIFSVSLSVSDANQSNNYAAQNISMPYYNNYQYNQPTYYPNQYPYAQPNYMSQPYNQYQYNQPYQNYNPYPIVY